jgi:hypothetical protein
MSSDSFDFSDLLNDRKFNFPEMTSVYERPIDCMSFNSLHSLNYESEEDEFDFESFYDNDNDDIDNDNDNKNLDKMIFGHRIPFEEPILTNFIKNLKDCDLYKNARSIYNLINIMFNDVKEIDVGLEQIGFLKIFIKKVNDIEYTFRYRMDYECILMPNCTYDFVKK